MCKAWPGHNIYNSLTLCLDLLLALNIADNMLDQKNQHITTRNSAGRTTHATNMGMVGALCTTQSAPHIHMQSSLFHITEHSRPLAPPSPAPRRLSSARRVAWRLIRCAVAASSCAAALAPVNMSEAAA